MSSSVSFIKQIAYAESREHVLEMIKRGIFSKDRRYQGSPRAQQRAEEATKRVANITKELTIYLVRRAKLNV